MHVVAFADHAYTMVFVVQEIFTLEAVFEDRRASDIEDDWTEGRDHSCGPFSAAASASGKLARERGI